MQFVGLDKIAVTPSKVHDPIDGDTAADNNLGFTHSKPFYYNSLNQLIAYPVKTGHIAVQIIGVLHHPDSGARKFLLAVLR